MPGAARGRRAGDSANALHKCVFPAYDQCIKASHVFNLLDARGVISVTERQSYILRVRTLAKACGEAFLLTDAGGANDHCNQWGRVLESCRCVIARPQTASASPAAREDPPGVAFDVRFRAGRRR
jgi:hypothetical protein